MSINLELLYGCIDYLENQFIHVVRISALLDQQIFQFYKALKQKASIMAIHINMKCFFSHTMTSLQQAVYPPQICQQKDVINFKKMPFTR